MDALFSIENLIAFLTLSSLEIVLGIDNIVFIVVITNRLPETVRAKARNMGLVVAMVSRIVLLFAISWIMRLSDPLFAIFKHEFSGRDLVLLVGGLFLLGKATFEIHDKLESDGHIKGEGRTVTGIGSAIVQILLLDTIFSIDSVITAVGMAEHIGVMVAAIVTAVGVMLLFAGPVGRFVSAHPTIQMLAFSFLLLVGIFLVAEGLGKHIDRGYIYFAMGFSLFVEALNLTVKKRRAAKSN
ncbi:TerC family protein [Desulfovibrio ferrophilus]|uniref:Integral membrane protein TerC n=1 Tax=Desulfovibrio ferrophilus TaxID=241368 RepID=A0A2Z6AX82_9BACT|nr:TerC family protein [Desulfovibrio ferrophilus]BBD07859.1 integral membrane protein TerC [Desulfovibrio ferrophilus]